MTCSDVYPLSREGLAALHADIERDGLMAVGIAAGHPPLMAQRAAAYRLAELRRELGIDDPGAL
ncbi:hypothetical protein [Cyanobium sp. Lug-B]|uniref:hypothetical protein n=1 Tax=Cyanobium sp. Lug-B TaxID=2823716 RepID=UPI0020CC2ACD|nr:hypothetical protein [Cyanobium sp. Lug-B]MCP9796108.1 hypothetical protein [Cyanobium sp. Lug-B]